MFAWYVWCYHSWCPKKRSSRNKSLPMTKNSAKILKQLGVTGNVSPTPRWWWFLGGSFESIGLDEYGLCCQPLREKWHCLRHPCTGALGSIDWSGGLSKDWQKSTNLYPKKRLGFWCHYILVILWQAFTLTYQQVVIDNRYQLLEIDGCN